MDQPRLRPRLRRSACPTGTTRRTLRAGHWCWLLTLLLLSGTTPLMADSDPDPVLSGVLEMLEAELSSQVIKDWLDGSPERPRRPTAAEMVALKRAGADDALLHRLLELAASPARPATPAVAVVPPAESAPDKASPTEPAPAAPATTDPAPAASRPAPTPTQQTTAQQTTAKAESTVPVTFELSYAPDVDEDEPEWDLFVYLDGEPLTLVPSASPLLGTRTLRFERALEPGPHVLRLVQERHERRGRDKWLHLARAAPVVFPLTLTTDGPAAVAVRFRQGLLQGHDDPLVFQFRQGDTSQLEDNVGGDPEDWPMVCEEVRANTKADGELPRSMRRQLEGCVAWDTLWEDPGPTRDEIRQAMATYRYRPIAQPEE